MHYFSFFPGCPKNYSRTQEYYNVDNGDNMTCCSFDSGKDYGCAICDCYRVLDIQGNYSKAVQACSSDTIWYSDSNADIVSVRSYGKYYNLNDALLTGIMNNLICCACCDIS